MRSHGLSAPQVGVRAADGTQYCGRVTRIATPFDQFMAEFTVWLDGAWYLWIVALLAVAGVVAIVAASKMRARVRAQAPQYRRTEH